MILVKPPKLIARFAMGPTATEEDLVKYAFALFLNHDFDKVTRSGEYGIEKECASRGVQSSGKCIIILT